MRHRNPSLAPKHHIIKKQYHAAGIASKCGSKIVLCLKHGKSAPLFSSSSPSVSGCICSSSGRILRKTAAPMMGWRATRGCPKVRKRTPLAQAPLARLKQATFGSSQTTNLNTTSRRKGSTFHLQQHVWRGNATPYRTIKPRCFGFLHAKTAATHECSIRDYCSPCRANCKFSILS